MRFAAITDIHSNLDALAAVLADIDREGNLNRMDSIDRTAVA